MDKINILGTEYSLEYLSSKEDKKLENLDGYTDFYLKRIVIEKDFENRLFDETKIKNYQNKILRHEIIHAFLFESGLECNSLKIYNWAEKETFEFAFKGIPKGSIVSISTIGVKRNKEALKIWQDGMDAMIEEIEPSTILVYRWKIRL